MSPRYVRGVDEIVMTCQQIRDSSQDCMSHIRPSMTEVRLWSAIEILADCVELLAAQTGGAS